MNATVTIQAGGNVNPKTVTIAMGGRVTFVNNDSVFHEMSSDPHPVHTQCPEINSVGVLAPGQSRQTAVFSTRKDCGYHDHGQPGNGNLEGTISIQ